MISFLVMRVPSCTKRVLPRILWWAALIGAVLVGGTVQTGYGQQIGRIPGVYDVVTRPDSASYRTFSTGDYQLIYPADARNEAEQVAQILRDSAATTHDIVGQAEPRRPMPIVLNGYNDRANGFVRPLPFKQEIEIPSTRTPPLTARYASWFEAVGPHELTHALQAEYRGGFGAGRVIDWFAPDVTRALNLSAPRGWVEGAAVYRESQNGRGAGRLRLPAALMPYRAAMGSDNPWKMAHALHPPRYTQPFDRHYLGGGQVFQHLVEHADNPDEPYAFFHRALAWNYRFPLLGYGAAIWYGTKTPISRLSDQFIAAEQDREAERIEALGALTEATPVTASRRGLNHRRPLWTHSDTLVAYRSGYRTVPGVYRVHVPSGRAERVAAHARTADAHLHLSPDSQAVWMSRLRPARTVPTQSIADAETLTLDTGTRTSQSERARLFAPAPASEEAFWAAQVDGPVHRLVRWPAGSDAEAQAIATAELPPRTRIQQMAMHPTTNQTVALLNRAGDHTLYTVTYDADAQRIDIEPLFRFEEAAIYDVSWGPEGDRLAISADPTGVPNVFVLDLDAETAHRVTNEPYGALEPALDPAGQRLAYVRYAYQRHDLVTVPVAPTEWTQWSDGFWNDDAPTHPPEHTASVAAEPSAIDDDIARADDRVYRARRHMRPRMVYPTAQFDLDELESPPPGTQLGLGIGMGIAGADPLQRWAYRAEMYYQAGDVWGEARLQTGRWWGQPSLSAYRRPYTTTVSVRQENPTAVVPRQVGVEERGVELAFWQPYTLRSNVYQSLVQVQWRSEFRQTRLFADFIEEQPLRSRVTLRPQLLYAYRLQQNTRDLIPRTGWVVSARPFVDAWTDGITAGRALNLGSSVYLPWLDRFNTGLRVGIQTLSQNRSAIFDLDTFVPRGYSDVALPQGTYARFDLDVVQPVAYPDRGSTLLGVMAHAFYVYGTAQTLRDVHSEVPALSSATVGLGARLRLGYNLPVDVRVGASYRFRDDAWRSTFR